MNHNFGGGRGEKGGRAKKSDRDATPAAVPKQCEWQRRITGSQEWKPLRTMPFVGDDLIQIETLVGSVRSGAFKPDPRHNPYKRTLSSGRELSFQWRNEPSVHACVIFNITYTGQSNTSELRWF